MTDAEVIAEFQRRRLFFREKVSRPSLLIGVPGILLLGIAYTALSGFAAVTAYVAGVGALGVAIWLFLANQAIYRCPRCGTLPGGFDQWDMNPKQCKNCAALLK
jgi:hypothetical protein